MSDNCTKYIVEEEFSLSEESFYWKEDAKRITIMTCTSVNYLRIKSFHVVWHARLRNEALRGKTLSSESRKRSQKHLCNLYIMNFEIPFRHSRLNQIGLNSRNSKRKKFRVNLSIIIQESKIAKKFSKIVKNTFIADKRIHLHRILVPRFIFHVPSSTSV